MPGAIFTLYVSRVFGNHLQARNIGKIFRVVGNERYIIASCTCRNPGIGAGDRNTVLFSMCNDRTVMFGYTIIVGNHHKFTNSSTELCFLLCPQFAHSAPAQSSPTVMKDIASLFPERCFS